jgi:hypothetical protein
MKAASAVTEIRSHWCLAFLSPISDLLGSPICPNKDSISRSEIESDGDL